jgi:hypothetical protein
LLLGPECEVDEGKEFTGDAFFRIVQVGHGGSVWSSDADAVVEPDCHDAGKTAKVFT